MIKLAENLELPIELVVQTVGIIAKKGVGKTYAAGVLFEGIVSAGQQVIGIDPLGVMWGLRSSADGSKPGLPVLIFGGENGDLPLEDNFGEIIADFLIESSISAVLDLSGIMNLERRVKFVAEFCTRLYLKNNKPVHLIVDEADVFAPQNPKTNAENDSLSIMDTIVRRGRVKGIGFTFTTQRTSVIHKNILSQIEVLIAMRLIAPQDRKAVDDWIRANGTEEQRKTLLESLASLEIGEAWFWSPGWLNKFEKIRIRQKTTFDSSKTPKVGEVIQKPENVAKIDLTSIRNKLIEIAEREKKPEDGRIYQFKPEGDMSGKIAEYETQIKELRATIGLMKSQIEKMESERNHLQLWKAQLKTNLLRVVEDVYVEPEEVKATAQKKPKDVKNNYAKEREALKKATSPYRDEITTMEQSKFYRDVAKIKKNKEVQKMHRLIIRFILEEPETWFDHAEIIKRTGYSRSSLDRFTMSPFADIGWLTKEGESAKNFRYKSDLVQYAETKFPGLNPAVLKEMILKQMEDKKEN